MAYSNPAKAADLDVPPALIEAHGAVSEPVAVAMAEGLRRRAGVEVAVAVTGIAGPGGGSAEKPVGTVCLAVAGASGAVVAGSLATATLIVWRHRSNLRRVWRGTERRFGRDDGGDARA